MQRSMNTVPVRANILRITMNLEHYCRPSLPQQQHKYYYYYFLTLVLNSQGMKKSYTKKYKNQAGMNITPPPPSQNSHAVRWHCTAESKRRVAEIKIIQILKIIMLLLSVFIMPKQHNI